MAHPIELIKEELMAGSKGLAEDLPAHIDVIAFINTAVQLLKQRRKGAQLWDGEQVSRSSLHIAIREAARDGMMLDGREATIVTFSGEAKYMQLVGGIMRKIHNTGQCKAITVGVVYDQEPWVWDKGEEEILRHTPLPPSVRGDTLVAAYAVIKYEGGIIYREWMWAEELRDIEDTSRNKAMYQGPWREEMLKKAPLRRLSKRAPMSTEDQRQAFKTWDADFEAGRVTAGEIRVTAGDPTLALGEGPATVQVPEPEPEAPQPAEAREAPERPSEVPSPRRTRAAEKVAQARSSQAPQAESAPEEPPVEDDPFEGGSYDGDIL